MKRERIFTLNNPYKLRVDPSLATEIGLNESIVLLQIEYLISISDKTIDGHTWTYDSIRNMKEKYFPWWSIATINRTIIHLEQLGLIVVENHNRAKYDKTRWFRLNFDKIKTLESVGVFQNETGVLQNETHSAQNETTIPKTSTKTSTNVIDTVALIDEQETKESVKADETPSQEKLNGQAHFVALMKICKFDSKLMTKDQRGQLASESKRLKAADVTAEQIERFSKYWYGVDWRGKKGQAPTPAQVRAEWGKFKESGYYEEGAIGW